MTNQEWINRGQEALMSNYGRFPIALVRGVAVMSGMLTINNTWIW